jgi:hypothetical protein
MTTEAEETCKKNMGVELLDCCDDEDDKEKIR